MSQFSDTISNGFYVIVYRSQIFKHINNISVYLFNVCLSYFCKCVCEFKCDSECVSGDPEYFQSRPIISLSCNATKNI